MLIAGDDCVKIPASLTAGTTIKFSICLPCYKASDGWQANLYLRGPASIDLTAQASGDNFIFSESAGAISPASGSSSWKPGVYFYALRVAKDAEAFEVETGSIEILPNVLDSTVEFDGRSQVKRILDAINALIEKKATKDQQRYVVEVNGSRRELWRLDWNDLLKVRDRYQAMYNAEVRSKRGSNKFGPKFRMRF